MNYKYLKLKISDFRNPQFFIFGDDLFYAFNRITSFFIENPNYQIETSELIVNFIHLNRIDENNISINIEIENNQNKKYTSQVLISYEFENILINYSSLQNNKIEIVLCILFQNIYSNSFIPKLIECHYFFPNIFSKKLWERISNKKDITRFIRLFVSKYLFEMDEVLCNQGGGPGPLQTNRNFREIFYENKIKKDKPYILLKFLFYFLIASIVTYFFCYEESNQIISLFSFEYMLPTLGILLAIYIFLIDNNVTKNTNKKYDQKIKDYKNSINNNLKLFFYLIISLLILQLFYNYNFDIIFIKNSFFIISFKSFIFFMFSFISIVIIDIIKDLLFCMLDISKLKENKKHEPSKG